VKSASIIAHAVKLLASGVFAAVGFILLAGGAFFEIEINVTNRFFTLLAFQLLAVTVAVLGADRKILAILVSGGFDSIKLSKKFYAWLVIITFMAFIVLGVYYELQLGFSVLICFTIVFDTISTIKVAELSAKLRTNLIFISNIVRYPLFFALLFLFGEVINVTIEIIFSLFLVASVLRLIIIGWPSFGADSKFIVVPDIRLGSFQIFNYSINRGAQTLIGLSAFSVSVSNQSQIFFYWKLIELIDKAVVALIPLFLNLILKVSFRRSVVIVCSVSFFSFFLFLVGASIFLCGSESLSVQYIAFLAAHAALIYPSNICFLLALRELGGELILKASSIALAFSIIVLVTFSFFNQSLLGLLLFSPTGLLLMICIIIFSRIQASRESVASKKRGRKLISKR